MKQKADKTYILLRKDDYMSYDVYVQDKKIEDFETEEKAIKFCEEWGWTYDDSKIHGSMCIKECKRGLYKDEEKGYYVFRSKNDIEYDILEGVTIGSEKKCTSDIIFITLLNPDFNMDNIVVGYLFGAGLIEKELKGYEESISELVSAFEKKNGMDEKIIDSDCAYTGGGIWLSYVPFTYEGKELLLVVSSEEIGEFTLYYNIHGDFDECCREEDVYQYYNYSTEKELISKEIADVYKKALNLMIDKVN